MGDGWEDARRLEVWWAVLGTTFGEVWRWHLGLSLLAILSLLLPERLRAQALALCSALLLVSGVHRPRGDARRHAGRAAPRQPCGAPAGRRLLVRLPAPLLVCLRYLQPPQWRSDAITTLIRFSRWGTAVAAVIVTGIVNSLIILGGWPLNLGSPYQRLLLIKTALVALMVMVALANRYAIVPAMSRVPALAQRGVVLACWLEVGLGMAVLLLVSLFATYAPV